MTPLETIVEPNWPWPSWTGIAAIIVLVFVSYWLYRREPTRTTRFWMSGCRIVSWLALAWMLGGWQLQQHRTEPAQLIIAVDDSVSMSFADEYRNSRAASKVKSLSKDLDARVRLNRFEISRRLLTDRNSGWLKTLDADYRVKMRTISDEVRELPGPANESLQQIQPSRPISKLGQSVRELLSAQQGSPTAAMVLLTDGVTTSGPTLAEAADLAHKQSIPLFMVGVGGDDTARDVRLSDLIADDIAFAGDSVLFQAQLIAEGLKNQKTVVRLKRSDTGEVLSEEPFTFDQDSFRATVRLQFRPLTAGQIPLMIEAVPLAVESDRANNVLSHTLNVNDVTIKVLYIQAYPSYEYRFLKNLLSRATRASDPSAKAFDVTTVLQEADREHADQDEAAATLFPTDRTELFKYDVVLFGDVDPTLLGRTAINDLVSFVEEHGGGVVFLSGPRFTPYAYRDSALSRLFPFDSANLQPPDSTPTSESFSPRLTNVGALQPACQLESTAAANILTWSELPQLYWFLELPDADPGARILLEHPSQMMLDRRPLPLILQHYVGAGRVTFHATDETYRWARFRESDEYYARYWLQTLRSLSRPKLLSGQSVAEINTDRQQYLPGDEIQVRVRFRDDRSNVEDVTVSLERSDGQRQTTTLQKSAAPPSQYATRIRDLPAGNYRVLLMTPLLDPAPIARTFRISSETTEQIGVPLNKAELQLAAKTSGGEYYDWFEADRLIRDLPRGQRMRIESLPPRPIWNSPLVAAIFVGMLTVEWVLRKRQGLT